ESELFGHERGAFTGADRQKRGLLETADGGTVFLDEIGEMVPGLQAKLLRFLEEKTFKRVGGAADIRVDVRVIGATNRNLQEEVRQGRFREDLFYRLNVLPIALPPLRERAEDIARLVNFYVDAYNTEFKKHVCGVAPEAMSHLQRYSWPGNVRELRNAVERAMLLAEGDILGAEDFSPAAAGPVRLSDRVQLHAGGVELEQLERSQVVHGTRRLSKETVMIAKERVQAVLDRVRPFLNADGGDIELIGVEGNSAAVRLTGMCAGCPSAHMTLHVGIETALREEIPEFDTLRVA